MRYIVIGIVIIFIIATAAPVLAHVRPPMPGEVSVEIVSANGDRFRSFPHQDLLRGGTRLIKTYLEAEKGEPYGIVIRNNTPERIGVVIAVDGRNIISGNRSDLKRNETMYLVNPHEDARYDGWRTSDSEVHRFYFTEPADSCSVRTFADSSAMGVIAVFREKDRPQPVLEQRRKEAAPAAPSSAGSGRSQEKALADESAGTGFGDAQYSPVIYVEFEPERNPIQKMLVKYEWRETLCGKGIIQCGQDRKNRLWDLDGYAPYPPGYPAN